MVRIALAGIVGVGCSTVSQVGNFVTDVNLVGNDTLLVTSCDVTITVTSDLNNNKNETAKADGCSLERLTLPRESAFAIAAPDECRASIARWQAATTKGRRQLWRGLPLACRAYVEEQGL